MDNLILAFNVVLPLFLCIALGYFLRRIGMMEEAVDQKAERMVFCGGAIRNNPMIQHAIERAVGLKGYLFGSGDEVHEGLMKLAQSIARANAQ